MSILDRLKDGFDMSDITGIISDLQKENIDLGNLLNNNFLKKYTDFSQLDDLLGKLGIQHASQLPAFLQNPKKKEEANQVVNDHSQFSSLAEMIKKAMKQ